MKLSRLLPAALCLICVVGSPSAAAPLERWFYQSTNLASEPRIEDLERLWRRAAALGYTHVLLSDSKFGRLATLDARYATRVERVKKLAAELHLEVVPALFSVGHANELLGNDVNLVEAQPVRDLPLLVRNGIAHLEPADFPALPADGFSDLAQWGYRDPALRPGTDGELHVRGQVGNARIFQQIRVQPWRQYHVSVRIRTRDFGGRPEIKVSAADGTRPAAELQWTSLDARPTQNWTVHHAVFNSQHFTRVTLIFGVWGSNGGELSLRDPRIEEAAFLNLVRRPGAPLAIATADGTPLVEGRDFAALADPLLGGPSRNGRYDTWHEPPALRVNLPDGTRLRASYHHAVTVSNHQASLCLTEPKSYELLRAQAQRLHALWDAKGYLMSNDEIRVINWCSACQARDLTPGQILADHVIRSVAILRDINPGGRIYTWSDMFDLHHNATPGPYYLVNGSLVGGWEGLDRDVIVVPWHYENRTESIRFFAARGHRQLIAGYYDTDPKNIRDWLDAARTVPESVIGVMFTTWRDDYSQLETFRNEIGRSR